MAARLLQSYSEYEKTALTENGASLNSILTIWRKISRRQIVISLTNSIPSIHPKKYLDKFYNFVAEEISQRCMKMDFALAEKRTLSTR